MLHQDPVLFKKHVQRIGKMLRLKPQSLAEWEELQSQEFSCWGTASRWAILVLLSFSRKQYSVLMPPTPSPMVSFVPAAPDSTATPTTPSFLAIIVLTLCDLERVQSPELGVNFQLHRVRGKSRAREWWRGQEKDSNRPIRWPGRETRDNGSPSKVSEHSECLLRSVYNHESWVNVWFHYLPPHRHHNLLAHSHLKRVFYSTCTSLSFTTFTPNPTLKDPESSWVLNQDSWQGWWPVWRWGLV